MNEPIAGALVKLTTESGRALTTLQARGKALLQRLKLAAGSATVPTGGKALEQGLKLTTEGGKALMTLPARGKALVRSMPQPVQLGLEKLSSRSAQVCREIFAGILVVGLIAIVLGYGRLAQGPMSLPTLVPTIEAAINDQLTDMRVKIDDAVLQRSPDGPGVVFRLRNIRLIDKDGSIIAQAPLAAIGMSGSALLTGRLAPGSVDFIGPRLLLFYNDDQGLSLTFTRPSAVETEAAIRGSIAEGDDPGAAPSSAIAKRPESPIAGGGRKLDLTSAVNDVFDRARKGTTSSHLTRFGFKDALVALDQNGTQTLWQVPDFSIDLEHRNKRSIIVGQANLASSKGDWQLELRTEQHPGRGTLALTALIQDLVPSGIAGNFPSIGIFRALDMAVDGEARLELSNSGEYLSGDANFRLAPGQITPPWDRDTPLRIDGGQLQVRYDAKDKGVIEILPSTLRWGDSKATVSGTFTPVRDEDGAPVSWNFRLAAGDTVFAVEEHQLAPIAIDEWVAEGNIVPKDGQLTLSRFVIRSGSAQVAIAGTVTESPEHPGSPEVKLVGEISPMPADTFKQFWPKFLAGKAREWALERITGGEVHGGKFNIALGPGELARIEEGADAPEGAIAVDLAASGLNIAYIPKMPPVGTGESRLTVAGTELVIDVPQGRIALPSGQEIALSEGRFAIPDLRVDPQQGEITFRATGATPAVLELLDHEPFHYLEAVGLKPDFLGGTTAGAFALRMPLVADLEFNEIKLNGTARLENALTADLLGAGGIPVEGGSFDVTVNEREVAARGAINIKGVPAELNWRRVFYAPDDQQPPATVTAVLDEAAREKLGFKINHLVKGKTPVELSIAGLGRETQDLSFHADLTDARLMFGDMGWTKPAGRAATVDFDVVKHEDGAVDLANLRIDGDEIVVRGSVSLDPEHRLKGFDLSDLSISRSTHVEIAAVVREDGVLAIRAEGPSFDGRQFFQSLFSPGQFVEASKDTGEAFAGVDFSADIGTVFGLYDTTATDVQVSVKKRNARLTGLDAKGLLGGKSPVSVRLEPSGNARLIKAESADAGAAFRLMGFYPSIEGGNARLQVNLDAGSQGQISGTLWAHDFTVRADSVVGDVLSDPSSEAVLGAPKQRGSGQRIAFTQLRAPFTVGGGKFRLRDAYMNGPQLGATMRGTVDFKSDTVELGGTYVPLYGLNSALGSIPILGKVFVGRKGEGVVGITFAIKGKLDNPTVLVNPMSVMTPGIFRQLFEFTGTTPEAAAATQATPGGGFGATPP